MHHAPATILVIDDEPKNLQVVGALLVQMGHEVIQAADGEEGILRARSASPDLILLDVMMPGLSGFDVCRYLKDDAQLREIPVIYLSAAIDKQFIVEGLDSGAVDYVTKPFHAAELRARVDLHLGLFRSKQQLRANAEEKSRFIEVLAHDLKNPLTAARFTALLLSERTSGQEQSLANMIVESANRAFEIVDALLEVRGLEDAKSAVECEPLCLHDLTMQAVRSFEQQAENKNLTIDLCSESGGPEILADRQLLLRVLENLVSNAVKFSPRGTTIHIEVGHDDSHGTFLIEDEGQGIPSEELGELFKRYARMSTRPTAGESSTGLGLFIVKELATTMKGTISYQASAHGGAGFLLRIPRVK